MWKYFKRSEFDCPCCHQNKTSNALINKLDVLRGKMGVAFRILSGYRCMSHNSAPSVGGKEHSMHLSGFAADVSTEGWNGYQKYMLIARSVALGFTGIGIGKNLIHLDIRSGLPVLWTYYD